MKRPKNIEGKNNNQLNEIKYQGERQIDAIKNYSAKKKPLKRLKFSSEDDQNSKEMLAKIKKVDNKVD